MIMARMRRKSRSDTHTLHLHMGVAYATSMPIAAGMTDARPSVHMGVFATVVAALRGALARALALVTRAAAWSVATVEDETPHNVIPMPGPAHGPVPAIKLRVQEQQGRKAS